MSIILNIFKQFLGDPHSHNEDTGQVEFDCPACGENHKGVGKHKLAVNYKKNIFKCWVCVFENNMHGKVPLLIKRYGNHKLLKEYELIRPDNDSNIKTYIPKEVKLPKGFTTLNLKNSKKYNFFNAYTYLKNRGVTDEMISYFNIGYTSVGKYKDRVILPSYDEFGDLNFFVGRAWSNYSSPKYLNPEAEKQIIIFNENKVNWDATIYLVEGAFDHLVIPNSIPILGKHLSDRLKQFLYKKAKAGVVILLDEDAYNDAIRLYIELNVGRLYNKIKLCIPPYNHDPSSIYSEMGNEGIVNLLRTSHKIPENKLY
jgi:hypothetical protein